MMDPWDDCRFYIHLPYKSSTYIYICAYIVVYIIYIGTYAVNILIVNILILWELNILRPYIYILYVYIYVMKSAISVV